MKENNYTCGYAINDDLNTEEIQGENSIYFGRDEQSTRVPSLMIALFDARAGVISESYVDGVMLPDTHFSISTMGEEGLDVNKLPPGALRHDGGANYVFLDGHTRWLKPTSIAVVCNGSQPCFQFEKKQSSTR